MSQVNTGLIPMLNQSLQIDLPEGISLDELKTRLANHINELIQNDFERLVFILYRIDVSETKLKLLIKENPNSDAGIIIADLVMERQLQKIRSRQEHRLDENISDDEKW